MQVAKIANVVGHQSFKIGDVRVKLYEMGSRIIVEVSRTELGDSMSRICRVHDSINVAKIRE